MHGVKLIDGNVAIIFIFICISKIAFPSSSLSMQSPSFTTELFGARRHPVPGGRVSGGGV